MDQHTFTTQSTNSLNDIGAASVVQPIIFDPASYSVSRDLPFTKEHINEYYNAIKKCSMETLFDEVKDKILCMSGQINSVTLVAGAFISTDAVFDPTFTRNHEFPTFVQELFWQPQKRVCSEFLNKLLPHVVDKTIVMANPRYITTEQLLILCDPCYKTTRSEPIQLIYKLLGSQNVLLNVKDQYFRTTSNFIMMDGELVYVRSILNVIIVPEDIDYQTIKKLETLQTTLSTNIKEFVLNIMDCTSRLTQEDFVKNLDNPGKNQGIFYTESKCFLEDSSYENLPVIINEQMFVANTHDCFVQHAETEDELNIDNCHNFLIARYIKKTLYVDLVGLYKLWCFFYMDRQYTSRNQSTINIVYSTRNMDYVEFRHLLNEPSFKSLLISCVGTYFPNELISAANNIFTTIRNDSELQRDGNRSMINVCKKHAAVLLHQLQVKCHMINIPFYQEENLDRTFLSTYLSGEGIYL
jgi:hypothetical protein